MKINVLIAGVGGASLGTELIKCLVLKKKIYNIFVCDISELAYGLFEDTVKKAYLSDREKYWESIKKICLDAKIKVIIPGGEQPMRLLNPYINELKQLGIILALNSVDVVTLCSNKANLFKLLEKNGIPVPKTYSGLNEDVLSKISFPCIIKPSEDSGGSDFVSLVNDRESAKIFAEQIMKSGRNPIFQEYLPLTDGEYSFSVLSSPSGELFGGIGIKKNFNIKLMHTFKSHEILISSGYSQGLISTFPKLFRQVCRISKLLKSCGPLNIEGRVINGKFYTFEINPRFSGSGYLWAKAGFNEVDYFVRLLCNLPVKKKTLITEGFYLRSLTEKFIPNSKIRMIKSFLKKSK